MKNIHSYLLIAITTLFLSSCVKTRLVGTWKTNNDKNNTATATFTFNSNGTLKYQIEDEVPQLDAWEYAKRKRQITISSSDTETKRFQIHNFTGLYLLMSDDEDSYALVKQIDVKSFNYQKANKKLRGQWNLIPLEETEESSESDFQLTLWDNGVFQQIINENPELGTWSLSDDTKSILLDSEEGSQSYGIQFLKNGNVALQDEYATYSFKKVAKTKKTPSNKKIERRIVGAWTFETIGEETLEIDYTLYLHSDGSLQTFEDQEVSKSGRWYVSEDGGFLVLEHQDGVDSYPIEKIKARQLRIKDEMQTIILKKISKL